MFDWVRSIYSVFGFFSMVKCPQKMLLVSMSSSMTLRSILSRQLTSPSCSVDSMQLPFWWMTSKHFRIR